MRRERVGVQKGGRLWGFFIFAFGGSLKYVFLFWLLGQLYTNDGWLWWQSYCLALLVIVVACINVSQAFALVTSSSLGLIPAGAARRIPI